MRYPMYAVRDIKTTFFPPMVAQNEPDAVRQFAMMVNNPSGVIGFAPKDFDLFMVGYFDTEKGIVEAVVPIDFVVDGSALVGESDEK